MISLVVFAAADALDIAIGEPLIRGCNSFRGLGTRIRLADRSDSDNPNLAECLAEWITEQS